jgi:archaetidylinositol phosphate synthase
MLSFLKFRIEKLLFPLTSSAVKIGIKPNYITVAGFILGITAALMITYSRVYEGVILLLLSSFMDVFDGAMARNENKTTEFGGFLDSVFDRYVDIAIFISLGFLTSEWLLSVVALAGALLVSYTRARAEIIIPKCDVGVAERGERLVLIIIGLLTGYVWHILVILAFLTHLTAAHRILYTYFQSREI